MSLSAVHAALSGLKTCQQDIGTTMDLVTDVAIDLMESYVSETGHNSGVEELQTMILECANMDREIKSFSAIVERLTAEGSQLPDEALFTLSDRVKEQFEEKKTSFCEAELHKHKKVAAFREGIRASTRQPPAENMDEDVAVTQSQVNFTCPLTQLEMENPMKNKVCNHHYDESAILAMIKARHKQQKKFCCPVVGCENPNVTQGDLVLDQVLKRKIQKQKRSGNKV